MAGNEWSSKGMTYFHGEYESDPYGLLAVEIVMHAIFDWRGLIKKRAWESESTSRYCNFDELRVFSKVNGANCCCLKRNGRACESLKFKKLNYRTLCSSQRRKDGKIKNEY